MHPAARPGGLSFASNGEKLRAISHSSLVSRLAARLRYGTAIQKFAVGGAGARLCPSKARGVYG